MSLSFDDRPAARPNVLKETCFFTRPGTGASVGAANTSVCATFGPSWRGHPCLPSRNSCRDLRDQQLTRSAQKASMKSCGGLGTRACLVLVALSICADQRNAAWRLWKTRDKTFQLGARLAHRPVSLDVLNLPNERRKRLVIQASPLLSGASFQRFVDVFWKVPNGQGHASIGIIARLCAKKSP